MSEAKHTRGPWHQGTELTQIEGIDGTIVCHVSGAPSNESVIADARLIAAAPELLEALKALLNECDAAGLTDARDFNWPKVTKDARAAIAKATGSSEVAE